MPSDWRRSKHHTTSKTNDKIHMTRVESKVMKKKRNQVSAYMKVKSLHVSLHGKATTNVKKRNNLNPRQVLPASDWQSLIEKLCLSKTKTGKLYLFKHVSLNPGKVPLPHSKFAYKVYVGRREQVRPEVCVAVQHQVQQQRRPLVWLQGQPEAAEQLGEVDDDGARIVAITTAFAAKDS